MAGTLGVDDGIIILAVASRHCSLRNFWKNSFLIQVVNLAVAITATVAIKAGFDRHYSTLSSQDKTQSVKAVTLLHSLLLWSFAIPKISIIALLNLLLVLPRWQLAILYSMVSALCPGSCVVSIFHWVQCTPIASQWNKAVSGKCWPSYIIAYCSLAFGRTVENKPRNALNRTADRYFSLLSVSRLLPCYLPCYNHLASEHGLLEESKCVYTIGPGSHVGISRSAYIAN